MMRNMLRSLARFCAIKPEMLPQLQTQLRKEPSLKALGPLFTKQNSEDLFNLILDSRMPIKQTNSTLDELFELCDSDTDRDLNLLANILKQKGINSTRTQNIPTAIQEFEQAVSTILLMERPDHLTLSQLYKFVGDLYVQEGELKKAEKSLKEALHVLAGVEGEDLKFLPSGLACIHTQLCMIHYRERRPMQALQELGKALKEWQAVPKKLLQEYELTCRLKCMLHILFQQKEQALQSAKHFMEFLSQVPLPQKAGKSKSLTFTKLYYLNIICSYQQAAKQQEELCKILKEFKAERGEEKLIELMVMVGIKPDRYSF